MVHLEVLGKVKDDVKLGAVNEDDVVDSSVDGRNEPNEPWAECA